MYRYGAPPTIDALADLMHEDDVHEEWRWYMAIVGWSLGRMHYRNYLPVYTDLIEKRNGAKVNDTRTGEEIVDDLAKKIRKRLEKGGKKK